MQSGHNIEAGQSYGSVVVTEVTKGHKPFVFYRDTAAPAGQQDGGCSVAGFVAQFGNDPEDDIEDGNPRFGRLFYEDGNPSRVAAVFVVGRENIGLLYPAPEDSPFEFMIEMVDREQFASSMRPYTSPDYVDVMRRWGVMPDVDFRITEHPLDGALGVHAFAKDLYRFFETVRSGIEGGEAWMPSEEDFVYAAEHFCVANGMPHAQSSARGLNTSTYWDYVAQFDEWVKERPFKEQGNGAVKTDVVETPGVERGSDEPSDRGIGVDPDVGQPGAVNPDPGIGDGAGDGDAGAGISSSDGAGGDESESRGDQSGL